MTDTPKVQPDQTTIESLGPVATLRELQAWLRFKLETSTKHQPVIDERGVWRNSWNAVLIPDWDVRQKLDLIEQAIAQPGGDRP